MQDAECKLESNARIMGFVPMTNGATESPDQRRSLSMQWILKPTENVRRSLRNGKLVVMNLTQEERGQRRRREGREGREKFNCYRRVSSVPTEIEDRIRKKGHTKSPKAPTRQYYTASCRPAPPAPANRTARAPNGPAPSASGRPRR